MTEKLWDRANRIPVLAASAAVVAVIAVLDWWTLPYVSLGFLYLFPIILAAGVLPRTALAAVCVVCAGLSEVFSSLDPTGRIIRLIFEVLAFAGCGLFISELLRNRKLSLETEARLRALVETSPAAIVILDQAGVIELANRAAVELMVPSEGNLIGRAISAFLPELQNALPFERGAHLRASTRGQVQRGDGETLVAEIWFSTYTEKGAPKLAAIIASVTEEQPDLVAVAPPEPGNVERPSLNNRQLGVLRLLFEGSSNGQIADRLALTPSAVKNTFQQLFSKTGANNRSQLVRVALERYRDLL